MKKIATLTLLLAISFSVFATEPQAKKTVKPIDLTKSTFLERVFDYETNPDEWSYKGDKPAIVDFHAAWCAPCRITSPILTELAAEYGDKIYVYKIDVDKEPELANKLGAKSLPMFLFIPMNEVPQMAIGALPKKSFREVIETFLLKDPEPSSLK